MATQREITKDCIAVAFYGIHANATSRKSFYLHMVAWFDSCECPIDKLSVHGPGFSGKPVGFAKGHERLLREGFADIESLSLFAMLPEGRLPTVDWWATGYLNFHYKPCFVLAARKSVTTLEDDRLAKLEANCLSELQPEYGIAYPHDHDEGPSFYAIGLNYGGAIVTGQAYEDKLTVSKWGAIGMKDEVYKQGLLRGVYPRNYLSKSQLLNRIENVTLGEWIGSSPSHGTLVELDDRMSLWKLTLPQISAVQDKLHASGIIFDWRKHATV